MLVHTNGLTGNNEKTNKKNWYMRTHKKYMQKKNAKKHYIGRSLKLRSKN